MQEYNIIIGNLFNSVDCRVFKRIIDKHKGEYLNYPPKSNGERPMRAGIGKNIPNRIDNIQKTNRS